jgi:uncharacterized membrane protein YccC
LKQPQTPTGVLMTTMAYSADDRRGVAEMLAGAVPALLFGIRVAGAVSLALFLAFYLQLETPSWAGTSACVVCQPILGSSLLKGVARMAGTMIGAVATMVLTAMLPQDRTAFLLAMLLWLSICGFVSALLRNFAAYAAQLAGFTLIIIASTSIAAPDQVFDIAVGRASEICVGIVCGTLVMALTDLGDSPRRLSLLFSALIAETARHLVLILSEAGAPHVDHSTQRRALIARVAALDPVIGMAAGESPELLQRLPILHAAMNGLFRALSGARIVETHLRSLPAEEAGRTARAILDRLPSDWMARDPVPGKPASGRAGGLSAVRRLLRVGTADLSMRLTADGAAIVVGGLIDATNGVTLLEDPAEAHDLDRHFSLFIADWLPALVSALRAFLGVSAAVLFWIVTAWPNGLVAVTFTAITVVAFAPRPGSNMSALGQALGTLVIAVIVAVIKFALLPNHESFLAFSLIIAIAMVPLGALSTVPILAPYLLPGMINFIPLLTPTNQISYDTLTYFNTALSLLAGCSFGVLALMLFPALSPRIRSQRLVDLSIRDVRRLATGRRLWNSNQWQGRIYARLTAMPEEAEPIQRAYLVSTLSVGIQVIQLQRLSQRHRTGIRLSEVLASLGAGNLPKLHDALRRANGEIASIPVTQPGAPVRLRARSALLAVSEAVDWHRQYFGGGAS